MLYQLVKNKDGEYFVLELYKDQAALDTHFKNMGAPGAIPLEKIKEEGGMPRRSPSEPRNSAQLRNLQLKRLPSRS